MTFPSSVKLAIAPPFLPGRGARAACAGCIVLQAGKTIILEKQKVLELADRHKIAVVGRE